MKTLRFTLAIIIGVVMAYGFAIRSGVSAHQGDDKLRTPEQGSAERKAILDAVHEAYKEGADQPAQFLVNYLQVHHGWTWINVTPLDAKGKQVADPAPLLFHSEDGKWVSKDLFDVPTDPNDHVGPLEPSAKYVKALQQKYPGVPADIVPGKKR
jgi:hypothetical protein